MNSLAQTDGERSQGLHDHLVELLRTQVRRYRRRLKVGQREFSEAAVHNLRVSIRRLLSTVELLGDLTSARQVKKVRRALKRQLDALGELRDAQVQLLQLDRLRLRSPVVRAFRAYLRKREKDCARQARKTVKHLKPGRVAALMSKFEVELRQCGKVRRAGADFVVLRRGVNEVFARVAALRQQIDPADADTIHRTRVAFKKFRYRMEALAPLLPGVSRERLTAMRRYQNLMGAIQDATVLLAGTRRFTRSEKIAARLGGPLRVDLERARRRRIDRYLKAANRLDDFRPPPSALARPWTAVT